MKPIAPPMIARLPACLALALGCAAGAHAETSPYYFGVSQQLTHTSNFTREADGEVRNPSTISSTALVGGIDQPFGRQRLRANATVSANRYSNNSVYNNNGYDLKAGLDWSTIERISGELNLNASRDLGSFDVRGARAKNIERLLDTSFIARIGVVTALTMEASLAHRELDNSATLYTFRDYKQDAVSFGARYRPSSALTWGAALRHTEQKYPDAIFYDINGVQTVGPDKVKRDDLDLLATLVATGASTINARISATHWKHSQATLSSYSGVTGAVTWNWTPTGKIRVESLISRETGAESRFLSSTNARQDDSQLTSALQVRINYQATAKINAYALGRYAERKLPDLGLSTDRSDKVYYASLGVRWAPIRPLTVGCDLTKEQRTASVSDTGTWPYHVNTYGCSGQFVFN